jgi:hypothetical protein
MIPSWILGDLFGGSDEQAARDCSLFSCEDMPDIPLWSEGQSFDRIGWRAVSRVFYRIILGPEPILYDFWSNKEKGKDLRNKRMRREWESAISVDDDLENALMQSRRFPFLGSHIVKIVVPDASDIEVRQTTTDKHHFSIYAPAEEIMNLVEGAAIPVAKEQ